MPFSTVLGVVAKPTYLTVLLLAVVPYQACASFYENCLLFGTAIGTTTKGNPPFTDVSLVFVPSSSYTLNGSYRSCSFWHGKKMIANATNPNEIAIEPGQTLAIHYRHYSAMCSEDESCLQETYTIVQYSKDSGKRD